jgi:hypothetical protein
MIDRKRIAELRKDEARKVPAFRLLDLIVRAEAIIAGGPEALRGREDVLLDLLNELERQQGIVAMRIKIRGRVSAGRAMLGDRAARAIVALEDLAESAAGGAD